MKISQIIDALEAIAPKSLAAEWDNVGLLVGDAAGKARKLMLCIDLTEQTLAEAVKSGANMVMAYHPVIFKPIARVTPVDSPVVFEAVRRNVAVYSMHTAYDAAPGGNNDMLARVLGIDNPQPLEPIIRRDRCKVVVFAPAEDVSRVAQAAFDAGAGVIGNYERCAFFGHGIGTFFARAGSHPAVGAVNKESAAEEARLEFVAPRSKCAEICAAVRAAHSYETPAIDVFPMDDYPDGCGMGRVGRLAAPTTVNALVNRVKKAIGMKNVLLARAKGSAKVTIAAVGAGICDDMFKAAIAAGAGFYLTGALRHHDALGAAAAGMSVCCVNHSNSERIALYDLAKRLRDMLTGLDVFVSRTDADPYDIV